MVGKFKKGEQKVIMLGLSYFLLSEPGIIIMTIITKAKQIADAYVMSIVSRNNSKHLY